jgi:hypothetical protein
MDKSKFNNPREWRKFGFGLSAIMAVLTVLQLIFHKPGWKYFAAAAVVSLILSRIWVLGLKPVFIVFSYLGFVMGWFMTRVILSILFFLVFTTVGTLSKLFGKGFLNLRFDRETPSYWIERSKEIDIKSKYENQF